jgi:uncharacterized protein (TIGR03437 family)
MLRALPLLCLWHAGAQGGPTLVGTGYGLPPQVKLAPGQIVTFWVVGLQAIPGAPVQATTPLPMTLANLSVTFDQTTNPKNLPMPSTPAPIVSIAQTNICGGSAVVPACLLTGITVQVPFELPVQPFTMPPYTSVTISENGTASQTFSVAVADDSIHILTTCGPNLLPCVTHSDGSLVTRDSPPVAGETIVIYAVGLGTTTPTVPTGQLSPSPAARVTDSSVDLDFTANAAPTRPGYPRPAAALQPPAFAGLTPGQVGLYQVNVQLPASFPAVAACGGTVEHPIYSNLTITVSSNYFSYDGVGLCVQVK